VFDDNAVLFLIGCFVLFCISKRPFGGGLCVCDYDPSLEGAVLICDTDLFW